MAEAVGLAASITALAGLAHTSLKFFKETRHIVRGMNYLDEETKRSMRRISFVAGAIKTSQKTLKAYCTPAETESPPAAIQFIEEHEAANFFETESEAISLLVDKLKARVRGLQKQWRFFATWCWRHFIKEEIQELREDLEFIQGSLNLLLNCVLLEVAGKRESRDEALIKHLKKEIKQKRKEIKKLSYNRVSASARIAETDYKRSTASLQQDEIEDQLHFILRLAGALRKTETVPSWSESNLRSGWSSSMSAASTRRTSQTTDPRREPHVPRQNASPAPPRLPSMPSVQDMPGPSEAPSRTHSIARDSAVAPTSRAVSRAGSEAGPSQALVPLRSPSIRSEDDFIGVHSREDLRIVTSPETRVEQGHIRYQDGEKLAVVAKVKPDQAFNFMTTFRASELGLLDLVQPHGDDDQETWIILPDGTRIQPHGTIQLRWYPRQSRSIPLRFLVLPRWSETEIVLGARYVAKEEYYAKRRRDGK